MFGRHDTVLACPDDEGGALEAGQALGRVEHEPSLCRDRTKHRTVSRRMSRCSSTGLIQRAVTASPRRVSHPKATGSRLSARSRICCHEQPEDRGRELAAEDERLAGQPRREVLERVAGDEHDPAHARGAVAGEQLDQRPAGVVADQRDVVQFEALEELRGELRQALRREIRVVVHGPAVRAERQRRCDAAVLGDSAAIT